ncbi:MAG: hypothetical protein EP326_13175 [Deltaproteobacteria bacterium]|nr:MAG: hypothetical protein EP326_13175 [Deltaproteobacteria bacterium]
MSRDASKEKRIFKRNEKGQVSIFLGICMTVILTMLAFIVNIGLFVKAKINLQNAVDAAAWSGAAVQARQLSNIGYMNWELRNTLKEWMFKYYVLGQMGQEWLKYPNLNESSVDFLLKPFGLGAADTKDKFNLPSICIHFGSPNNICSIYDVPGLPVFDTVGLPGISERHESFLASIRDIKSKDCSERGIINLETGLLWAYGTGSSSFSDLPAVAAHRIGAWIEALEIGFRMRNLESIVNRPPVDGQMCMGGAGCTDVNTLQSEFTRLPYNERPIKALISAYRNLGGGTIKDEDSDDDNKDIFTNTFRLTEIPPEPHVVDPGSLSGLLIPQDATISGKSAFEKYYLDLIAFPINMATLYTNFQVKDGVTSSVASVGECQGTRTAIPVPGYIHSFAKNHEVMTYYSVKGEAKYVGMFFPFAERGGVTLKAYASAKPFGGKIGPRLFGRLETNKVVARSEVARTTPYVFGLDMQGAGGFQAGELVPFEPPASPGMFWAKNGLSVIGGTPSAGQLQYVIPNLLYDFDSYGDLDIHGPVLGDWMTYVKRRGSGGVPGDGPLPQEDRGLLNGKQYKIFRANLVPPTGGILSVANIDASIRNVRRPTRYEAMNYMIPTIERGGDGNTNLDSIPIVKNIEQSGIKKYHIFAPLIHEDSLYKQMASIEEAAKAFLAANDTSITSFIDALKTVRDAILAEAGGDPTKYQDSANLIHDNNDFNTPGTCVSMNDKFEFFFNAESEGTGCGGKITPLKQLIQEYFAPGGNGQQMQLIGKFDFLLYYESEYADDGNFNGEPNSNHMRTFPTNAELHGAYTPGPRTGSPDTGAFLLPFSGNDNGIPKRNFYSTKFVSTSKLVKGGDTTISFSQVPVYKEKDDMGGQSMFGSEASGPSMDFKNKLEYTGFLDEFGTAANLDF